MLKDLNVVNGIITPDFNAEVYEYVVNVDDDVISLVLEYDVIKDASVTIYGNDYLTEGENHVLVEVYKDKVETYTLKVIKESSQEVLSSFSDNEKIEVSIAKDVIKDIATPSIAVVCFITIVTFFCIIFRHK